MAPAQVLVMHISIMLTEAEVYEVLCGCYDREIPVNIVDLGLVYGVKAAWSTCG
jgi:metal-sulfur cluster biosynthetic enzyme